jgi:hypothetical protein
MDQPMEAILNNKDMVTEIKITMGLVIVVRVLQLCAVLAAFSIAALDDVIRTSS